MAVAELINRMTPEERGELATQLSWEQLHALEELKRKRGTRVKDREPHIYVSISSDSISFESPPDKVAQLIKRIAATLAVETISMQLPENGHTRVLHRAVGELDTLLIEEAESLTEEPIVIEMGNATLYSQGGGCLFLKTDAPGQTKRAIAENFLQVCGYPHPVQSDQFTALVRNGGLEVIEP